MPELLRMPEVSADAAAAILAAWPLRESQPFAAGDVVAVIETAKAVVDVEADADGVLVKQLVDPGTDVRVGDPIALTAKPGETVTDPDAALAALGVRPLGVGSSADPTTSSAALVPTDPNTPSSAAAAPTVTTNGIATLAPARRHRIFSSPLARRLARQGHLSLELLSGSGPGGRILRRDVEGALANRSNTSLQSPTPADAPPAGGRQVPHSRMRRLIAERLTESKRSVPHFYLRGAARVDELIRLRAELNESCAVKISINDMVVKAVAATHRRVPAVNVRWGPDALTELADVDVAIAVATSNGLVTPVLRQVDGLPISALAAASRDLIDRAQAGQLRQAELEGGSTTVTNLGMFGTSDFDAIINPPQASILAVGAAAREAVCDENGALYGANVMHVTLSVDHRPIDGATAAQWMAAFIDLLEHPIRILA